MILVLGGKIMSDFIAHYGVKGQKWGVVNEDETAKEQISKQSLDEYKSKTDQYKEARERYGEKLSSYKSSINDCLNDMASITDRKEMLRAISKFNDLSGYYNSLNGKLQQLDGVIEKREQVYNKQIEKINRQTKKVTKTTKTSKEETQIKPTGKFYRPSSKKKTTTSVDNIAEFVSELQIKRKTTLAHHGVEGQKWGVRNGPPYPLDSKGQYKKIKSLNDDMNNNWDYGVILNGKKIDDLSNMDFSKYRTIPIDILKKEKIGLCWDFVNYQHYVFKENGYPDKTYMVVSRRSDDPEDILTHTFSIVDIGNKRYWFESAKWNDRGVHEVKNYNDVINKFKKDNYIRNEYDIYEFNPDGMDNNLTDKEYFNIATSDNNLVETSQSDNYKKIK